MTKQEKDLLLKLAAEHGTPIFIIDHDKLRANFKEFRERLPEVQPYFAIKSNSHPEIVKTMFDLGASFDVASMPEFMVVHENIKDMPDKERQDFIWDKIIYANTIKPVETLKELNQYKPLVTFDNAAELKKIKEYAPDAGLVLRIRVPNTGSIVELSSKFGAHPGEAVDLIAQAIEYGLGVEGISFHVGSQCNNFDNYLQALNFSHAIFKEAELRKFSIGFTDEKGQKKKVLDLGGGFPAPYNKEVKPFSELAKMLNTEIKRLFGHDNVQVVAEPGRFMVATACTVVTKIVGKAIRDGKTCYYLNDGVYHTFSGQVFDHQHYPLHAFKEGPTTVCATFGPTCDAFDTISLAEELPDNLEIHDLLYAENVGAYTWASSTYFNGFPPAKVVHVNLKR